MSCWRSQIWAICVGVISMVVCGACLIAIDDLDENKRNQFALVLGMWWLQARSPVECTCKLSKHASNDEALTEVRLQRIVRQLRCQRVPPPALSRAACSHCSAGRGHLVRARCLQPDGERTGVDARFGGSGRLLCDCLQVRSTNVHCSACLRISNQPEFVHPSRYRESSTMEMSDSAEIGAAQPSVHAYSLNIGTLATAAEPAPVSAPAYPAGGGATLACQPHSTVGNSNNPWAAPANASIGGAAGPDSSDGEAEDNVNTSSYHQLKMTHSRKIANLRRSDIGSLRDFIAARGLNEQRIQTLYTEEHVYNQLNQALSQELKAPGDDDFPLKTAVLLGDVVYRQYTDNLPSECFRGIGMYRALLRSYRSNIGRTVYFYPFTSTSRSETQATRFARSAHAGNSSLVSTLFKITLQRGQRHAVADVSSVSAYQHEEEILIAPNSGFRIDSVTRVDSDSGPLRVIHLTLVDQRYSLPQLHPSPWEEEMPDID